MPGAGFERATARSSAECSPGLSYPGTRKIFRSVNKNCSYPLGTPHIRHVVMIFPVLKRTIIIPPACKILLPVFAVNVVIENKPGIADPEGATILSDLVMKGDFTTVSDIRTAKMLRFTVNEPDRDAAVARIKSLCEELRIYNPVVSRVRFEAEN